MKLVDLLREALNHKYTYGCVLINFDLPQVYKIQDAIDPKDLYEEEGYGFEKEPHCTLLFGLHEGVSDKQVKEALEGLEFKNCQLKNISLFENEEYEVLKFDVHEENLAKANKELSKLPHTTEYPDYKPHTTIAYLKKGTGKRYVKAFNKIVLEAVPSNVTYSKPDKSKVPIKNFKKN